MDLHFLYHKNDDTFHRSCPEQQKSCMSRSLPIVLISDILILALQLHMMYSARWPIDLTSLSLKYCTWYFGFSDSYGYFLLWHHVFILNIFLCYDLSWNYVNCLLGYKGRTGMLIKFYLMAVITDVHIMVCKSMIIHHTNVWHYPSRKSIDLCYLLLTCSKLVQARFTCYHSSIVPSKIYQFSPLLDCISLREQSCPVSKAAGFWQSK